MVAMTNSKREVEKKGKWAFGEVERNERLLYHIVICSGGEVGRSWSIDWQRYDHEGEVNLGNVNALPWLIV
jgi:hypothetical protein